MGKNIQCLESQCKRYVRSNLDDLLCAPCDIEDKKLVKLLGYFQYRAPNIESIHSETIDRTMHEQLYNEMFDKRHFKNTNFCSSNVSIEKELQKVYLYEDKLCIKCKRFICKKKQKRKNASEETNLECLLRHIRNSIAHGRTYYYHAGNRVHILFEDRNSSGKISARILCIRADLEEWKRILERPRNFSN